MGLSNNESSCLPVGVSLGFLDADLHVMWHGDVRYKGYIRAGELYVAVERTITCELTASQKAKKASVKDAQSITVYCSKYAG